MVPPARAGKAAETAPQECRASADAAPADDGESLSALYPAVYRRALYLIGDPATAEDAAQETFFRYLTRRPAGLRSPAAWLATVCTRLCYDWMRSRSRRAVPLEAAEEIVDPGLLPEEVLTDREDLELARQALERLDPRDRTVLLLRHSSTSYREIAAVVGCAESSVGSLLHRAERRFRDVYQRLASDGPSR